MSSGLSSIFCKKYHCMRTEHKFRKVFRSVKIAKVYLWEESLPCMVRMSCEKRWLMKPKLQLDLSKIQTTSSVRWLRLCCRNLETSYSMRPEKCWMAKLSFLCELGHSAILINEVCLNSQDMHCNSRHLSNDGVLDTVLHCRVIDLQRSHNHGLF